MSSRKQPKILAVHQQNFIRLGLACLHGAPNLRCLEQRRTGMHRDFEFATAGLVRVIGKLQQVLVMKVGGGVGGDQGPLGLGETGGA